MSNLIESQPTFSLAQATGFVRELYGIDATLVQLDSERDQNFLVTSGDRPLSVLKIANPSTPAELLEQENRIMLRLAKEIADRQFPYPIAGRHGRLIEPVEQNARTYPVRLVHYIPGRLLADHRPVTDHLLEDLGGLLGRMTRVLGGVSATLARENFPWNLDLFPETVGQSNGDLPVASQESTELIAETLKRYRQHVLPRRSEFRKSLIHNDANDRNVIVSEEPVPSANDLDEGNAFRVRGIIDFGDMVFASTVNEVAIGVAYAMLNRAEPLDTAASVLRGFARQYRLSQPECESVFELACARLATSLWMSARQSRQNPDNEYLSVSTAPALETLTRALGVSPEVAAARMRFESGFSALPTKKSVVRWIDENREEFAPVLGFSLTEENSLILDMSVFGSGSQPDDLGTAESEKLLKTIQDQGKKVGIGRYQEPRTCYQGEQFHASDPQSVPRTIHMGCDLFVKPGSQVFCPLEGEVHTVKDNDEPFDYGPTVILRHRISDGKEFFTLFGHLARESIDKLQKGSRVRAGDPIAKVGTQAENGGWTPHLHFQVMTCDMVTGGNCPGVARADELEFWRELLIDPTPLVGTGQDAPSICFPAKFQMSADEILAKRKKHLNPSLSLSYRRPLHIVRGRGQYLYDSHGLRYLDCVNNVCHVGHCHPHVVSAASNQLSLLNTNTRYLHEEIVRFAERLAHTMPRGSDVCYIVNSGSEANDLALRLARSFTARSGVVCVEGAYHGNLSSLIEISPYKFDGPGGAGRPGHVRMLPMPDPYRGRHRQEKQVSGNLGEFYADFFDSITHDFDPDRLADKQNLSSNDSPGNEGIAAFICESILSCGGQIVLPDGYLASIYTKARRQGIVCIADEVQVGMGRVGKKFWGFELQSVEPDIVTIGKPVGNGFPLGAVVTRREIADAFNNGMEYFNTFGGNPVACAAGNAVLDVIEREGLQQRALETGKYFVEGLLELKEEYPCIGDIRGEGLFLGIELVANREDRVPHPKLAQYVVERLKELRILLSTDGPQRNVIKIKPPLVIEFSDVNLVLAAMRRVLAESSCPAP